MVSSSISLLHLVRAPRRISCFNWFDCLLNIWRSTCWYAALYLRLACLAPASSSAARGNHSGLALGHGLAFGQYRGRRVSRACWRHLRGSGACCQPSFFSASVNPSISSFWIAYRRRSACLLAAGDISRLILMGIWSCGSAHLSSGPQKIVRWYIACEANIRLITEF
jgi:hypothetical protein